LNTQDYYKVLGVDPGAQPQQIKAAYRNLAFQYHPDRNKADPGASEKMKAVNEAYAVLSNAPKRAEYDRLRQQFGASAYHQFRQSYSEQDIFRGSDVHQIFEEMARAFGLRGVEDIFRETYGQGYRTFEFQRPGFSARGFIFTGRPGRGRLRPAAADHLGKFSRRLLEKISGIALPERGRDRQDRITVSPETAARGGPYAYFVKEKSKRLVVQIPAGIRNGQRIRLAGMGADGRGGAASGDLYLTVRIQVPLLQRVKKYLGL